MPSDPYSARIWSSVLIRVPWPGMLSKKSLTPLTSLTHMNVWDARGRSVAEVALSTMMIQPDV